MFGQYPTFIELRLSPTQMNPPSTPAPLAMLGGGLPLAFFLTHRPVWPFCPHRADTPN